MLLTLVVNREESNVFKALGGGTGGGILAIQLHIIIQALTTV